MKYTILLLLAFSICLAQEPDNVGIEKLNIEQEKIESSVNSLSNIKNEALHESQKFYSDSFDKIQGSFHLFLGFISVLVAIIIGLLIFFNSNKASELEKEIKNQLNKELESQKIEIEEKLKKDQEEQKKEITDKLKKEIEEELKEKLEEQKSEIAEKLNKEFEETLKREKNENQNKSNAAHKKIAEIYYILARDELTAIKEGAKEEYENEHWYRHFINLGSFYFSLSRMSIFSENEFFLIKFIKKFLVTYKDKNAPIPETKFFYHFLPFIEHSVKINEAMFDRVKDIYHGLLDIFSYDKVVEHIKKSDWAEERIQRILVLAERYRNKAYQDQLGVIEKV